ATTSMRMTWLGMVVRDNVGDVLMAAGMRIDAALPALQEVWHEYAYEAGYRSLEVETDSLALLKLLQRTVI
ncbi:hypothetical protein SOVF_187300, partial [Spinacia oleracea]